MKFTKMHGIGNDYIYVNAMENPVANPEEASRILSDRHFGVGSDGLVLICPSSVADFRMQMHNSDGSQAEMCGNAIRCVGKYVYDRHLTDKTTLTIETKAGIKVLDLKVEDGKVKSVTVDMGEPILEGRKIPIDSDMTPYVNQPITVQGNEYHVTCVSMGNPHAVVYMEDVKGLEIEKIGPYFETHPLFPRKTNTEFVRVIDRNTLEMRVWERGAGETLACGTGACATLVATVLNGLCDRSATLKLLGGDLSIRWDEETNHVFMTGPAAFSFDGETDLV